MNNLRFKRDTSFTLRFSVTDDRSGTVTLVPLSGYSAGELLSDPAKTLVYLHRIVPQSSESQVRIDYDSAAGEAAPAGTISNGVTFEDISMYRSQETAVEDTDSKVATYCVVKGISTPGDYAACSIYDSTSTTETGIKQQRILVTQTFTIY